MLTEADSLYIYVFMLMEADSLLFHGDDIVFIETNILFVLTQADCLFVFIEGYTLAYLCL